MEKISHQELKEILSYDPATGLLRWIKPRLKIRVGQVAGSINPHNKGGSKIIIKGKCYWTHRIAWFHFYGEWPKNQIDHKDGDRMNNRIDNLREATNSQNCSNRRGWSSTGVKGVTQLKCGKFFVRIRKDKKLYGLGTYLTLEEAASVYRNAVNKFHGEFARAA